MKRKMISLLLAVSMAAGLCACGNSAGEGDAEEQYHATVMYLVSNDARDVDSVEKAFNELTEEQLNMTVDLVPVTWGSYSQQIQMLLASDEPLDICPVMSGNAGTYVKSDYLEDLSPYLDNVAKDMTDIVGLEDIKCCSVGDFIWGVPTMRERANPVCYVLRTDLLEESGYQAEDIKTSSDLTAVYEKVKELHPDMLMFGGPNNLCEGSYTTIFDGLGGDNLGVLMDYGQETTVTNWYESEEFLALCQMMYEWNQKGFVSKDLATSTDSGASLMKAGNLFSYLVYGKPNSKVEKDAETGYDTTIIQVTENVCCTSTTSGLAYGIASNTEDPEKAAELLNWIYKTKEANDLLNWGVEGKDYEVQEDGTINYPEGVDAENVGYHQDYGWAQFNQFNSYVWEGNDPEIWDQYEAVRENAIVSKAYGFTFDNTNVADEIVALDAVKSEMLLTITTGSVEPEAAIEEFNEALYQSGLQKVMDEKQAQLDEWLANQ